MARSSTSRRIAKRLLLFYGDSPNKWTKYVCARDESGNEISYSDKAATSFCLLGAALKLRLTTLKSWEKFREEPEVRSVGVGVTNDRAGSFQDIKALLETIAAG